MFSSWLPGIPRQGNNKQLTPSQVDQSALVKQILLKIEQRVDEELGEKTRADMQDFVNEINKEQALQSILIETKEKYHDLVGKLDQQSQALKEMLAFIIDFMRNLCEVLENSDMLTPIKDFENGFLNCNVDKVQKQLRYFSKLYEAAFEDYISLRLTSKANQFKEEVQLFKGLNKNLENQLLRSKGDKLELQKKLSDLSSKNSELAQKLQIIEKLGSQNLMKMEAKDLEKARRREQDLLQKVKTLEKEKLKLQKNKKDLQNELSKLNSAIQVIKNSEEQIIQEMREEIQKKEAIFSQKVSKFSHEKLNLQEKLKFAQIEAHELKEEISLLRYQQQNLKSQSAGGQNTKQLQAKITDLQSQIQSLKASLKESVSKQIMGSLFISYEDQSKQWIIRRDVKNQIHGLLGLKVKQQEAQGDGKKWFGLF